MAGRTTLIRSSATPLRNAGFISGGGVASTASTAPIRSVRGSRPPCRRLARLAVLAKCGLADFPRVVAGQEGGEVALAARAGVLDLVGHQLVV
jgi:hypothetical protein